MRRDMNEVIIEVARSGGHVRKGVKKYLTRERANDFENHPIRERTRQWVERGSQGDKLNPLRRYLDKHIGEKWDDVYSDICSVNDKRKMISFHLLDHLQQMVEFEGCHKRWYFSPTYFVDTDGTLQLSKRKVHSVKAKPVEEIPLPDGSKYRLEDGLWYHCWTETSFTPYSEDYLAEENGEVVIKKTPQVMVKHQQDFKFQCGKKKLKFIRDWLRKNGGLR